MARVKRRLGRRASAGHRRRRRVYCFATCGGISSCSARAAGCVRTVLAMVVCGVEERQCLLDVSGCCVQLQKVDDVYAADEVRPGSSPSRRGLLRHDWGWTMALGAAGTAVLGLSKPRLLPPAAD